MHQMAADDLLVLRNSIQYYGKLRDDQQARGAGHTLHPKT